MYEAISKNARFNCRDTTHFQRKVDKALKIERILKLILKIKFQEMLFVV